MDLYGLAHLGVVPLRTKPAETAEMSSQVVYGESFTILEEKKRWIRVRLHYDNYEGWLSSNQYVAISETKFAQLQRSDNQFLSNLSHAIFLNNGSTMQIPMGANLRAAVMLKHRVKLPSAPDLNTIQKRESILVCALQLQNSPYLWGGKTPWGLDCSGFVQLVYKLNQFIVKRDASQQCTQGQRVSTFEATLAGDLAFFKNSKGKIGHVGIVLQNNRIIHAHGKVRIDGFTKEGIFNNDNGQLSHKLFEIRSYFKRK